MSLTSEFRLSALWKKSNQRINTSAEKQPYEEIRGEVAPITQKQVRTDNIPDISPIGPPSTAPAGVWPLVAPHILQLHKNVIMTPFNSNTNTLFFAPELKNSIISTYGTGGYEMSITTSTAEIVPQTTPFIIDNENGTLVFEESVAGITNALPPRISFYRYIGAAGISSNSREITLTGTNAVNIFAKKSGVANITIKTDIPGAPEASFTIGKSRSSHASFDSLAVHAVTPGDTVTHFIITWMAGSLLTIAKTIASPDGIYRVSVSM